MVYCKIKKCLPYNVYILEVFNKQVEFVLEFYGVNAPKIGNSLVLHENLFDTKSPKFTQPYCFELSNQKVISENDLDEETAILKDGKNIYVLKRVYG